MDLFSKGLSRKIWGPRLPFAPCCVNQVLPKAAISPGKAVSQFEKKIIPQGLNRLRKKVRLEMNALPALAGAEAQH
jgi:hypothetical protein